jgi:hypothetical protein
MPLLLRLALALTGVFSLTLGAAHFFFPILFDFEHAVPKTGAPLKPFRLLAMRYATQRSDVHGIAWVMNHAASYGLVSIGALNLYWAATGSTVPWLAAWAAGWWFLRAASQLYLGRRPGDWFILLGFAALGVLHIIIVFI